MNDIRTRELYSSPNGDYWHLCKDASDRVFVLHQANIPSGGHTSQIELGDFLTRGYGPEQQALIRMIGTLIESPSGELLTGEGNPGLASGGSGAPSNPISSVTPARLATLVPEIVPRRCNLSEGASALEAPDSRPAAVFAHGFHVFHSSTSIRTKPSCFHDGHGALILPSG
jgi:hypothetical protein